VRSSGSPFDPQLAHTDIFTFKEDGDVAGVPVLRYTAKKARMVWPREVIPVSGWYSDTATMLFGGYVTVRSLPAPELCWALQTAYGQQWASLDGSGKRIVDFSCARHSTIVEGESTGKVLHSV